MWKRSYLSKEGRLNLVKSTLSYLPIYYMSLLVILSKVSLRSEIIKRDFIFFFFFFGERGVLGRGAPK